MPRAERLMELADRLRGAGATTVERLAAELNVTPRTIHRDLAALRARGMPISGEAGPGGGVRLEGGRGVTAVHLSIAEVVTMWLAATLSRAATDLPWSGAASTGLAKMLASLPRPRAAELRALCRRVIVGPPASATIRLGAGKAPPELLALFEEGFSAGVGLGFRYRDRAGNHTVRRAEPHGLLVQAPVWYMLARDIGKGEPRWFRMDRISAPRLLDGVRFRPSAEVIWAQLPPDCDWRPLSRR
jgi:predicted DNA-binding transcriptional regulator YafY